MRKQILISTAIFMIVAAISVSAQSAARTFRGNIADSRVEINLTRDGGNLSGSYFYTRVGKPLKLQGTIDADGNFKLTELDATGKKTGEFSGKWLEEANENGVSLEGEWRKPGSKSADDSLSFYASEQMIDVSGAAKITSKNFAEKNKPKRFDITVEYPEITGVDAAATVRFNQLSKQMAMSFIADFRKDMMARTAADLKNLPAEMNNYLEANYSVQWANDRLISVRFTDSVFEGGAHPNYSTRTLNFDLKSGKEIKLADLFQPKSAYLKAISDYSIADLKKQVSEMSDDDWIAKGAGASEENYSSWNLTKKGLMINFDPYQVAAYAVGAPTVIIPYDKLQTVLRKDGAFITK